MRNLLAVTEIALALVLLIGAGLMIKSFTRLQNVDTGFSPERLFTADMTLPRPKYRQPHQISAFLKNVLDKVKDLPGVKNACTVTTVPLGGQVATLGLKIEGEPPLPQGVVNEVQSQVASPSFFDTLGVPLLRGRVFEERDTQDTTPVVVISQTTADRFWPGQDPVGRRIALEDAKPGTWQTIIGVVGDVRQIGLETQLAPQVYETFSQKPSWETALIVRTTSEPMKLAAALREQIAEVDKDQPLYKTRSMEGVLAESISRPRFNTQLMSLLTALALVLTAIGIYGVIAYSVSHRFQEIGIRMALGAQQADILKMIVMQGLRLALAGILIGMVGAFILTRLMAGLLYDVSTTDPFTFTGVPFAIAVVVIAACYIPARRAMKVEPVIALKYE